MTFFRNYTMLNSIIDHIEVTFQYHEFLTAVGIIAAFYLGPIVARAIIIVLGGIIAFFLKMMFNDALEQKVRALVSSLIGSLLNNDKVEVRDIPLLDSDYLCIFKLHIPITDHLTVEIPTVRIRVRMWRLVRKTIWLYLAHLDNRLAFNGYFKLLCSDELKEINLQNASIIWECHDHANAQECYKETSFDFTQLNILQDQLKLYNFSLLWEKADLKINLPGERLQVENIGGYINNEKGKYEMYLHGLFEGQIMSIANLDKGIKNYRIMIPAVNLTPFIWTIICDNIPALTVFHATDGLSMGRMVNILCQIRITDKIEVADIEWTFRDGHGEYTGATSNHTYSLTAIEGTFHIKEMREFSSSRLNLKINNHNVGLAGFINFNTPINTAVQETAEDGIFSIAIDANNFSFINGLEISVLDRFILDGEIKLAPKSMHICFHSDKEHSVNALKFSVRDLSIIIDRFFGHITFEGAACFSQDLGCYLVSATRYGHPGIYDRRLLHLQSLYYDLVDQVYSIQARAANLDLKSFTEGTKQRPDTTSLIDIYGNFASNESIKTHITRESKNS